MLHKASSDGAVEMVRFLATECSSVDLEAQDKVNGPCVCMSSLHMCEAPTQWWYLDDSTLIGDLVGVVQHGNRALHAASSAGKLAVVQFLAAKCIGVDLHAQNKVLNRLVVWRD